MRKLNVAMVVESFHSTGGIERRTSELVRGLASAGHQVHVYANRRMADPFDGLVKFHYIPMLKLSSRMKPLSFAWACSMLIPKSAHDLIHTQVRIFRYHVATLGIGCHQAYLNAMGSDPSTKRREAFHRTVLEIERKMLAQERFAAGGKIITNSHRCKSEFIQYYGIPSDSIAVIHNGVDQEAFSPLQRPDLGPEVRKSLGVSPDEPVILFVGTGFERKGLDTLIRALGTLRSRSRARLIVVGRGDRDACSALAAAHGVEDRLLWVPRSDSSEMAGYYAAADIFVLPTRYDPFANSTMEALASGLPVITTTVNGVSEILRDNESALLVEPDDAAAISDRLSALVEDGGLRERLGASGRRAVEPYTWQQTTEKTLALYQSLLG